MATDFYDSPEWLKLRYEALRMSRGHITNLQVLCKRCNLGKGNRDETDWRSPPEIERAQSRSFRNSFRNRYV